MVSSTRVLQRAFSASVLLLLGTGSAVHAQFMIGQNFNGTNINQLPALNAGFEYIPPDTMGAIGPTQFAEFTNGSYTVYNKTNGSVVGSRVALTTFWQNAGVTGLSLNPTAGTGTTDTHVLYDPLSARWYATSIDTPQSGANRYLVAVSNSSDLTAGWKGFGITSNTTGLFADFPALGIDQSAIYVSTNNFMGNSATSVGVLVVPKASLLAGNVAMSTVLEGINPNTTGFSAQPIVDYSASGLPHQMLSSFNSTNLHLSTITGAGSTPTGVTSGNFLAVTGNSNTINARQPNGDNTINTGDLRFGSSVIHVGSNLWAVNTITQNTGGTNHEVLRWYRIDAASGTLQDSGLIGNADTTHDYYYGSIAVNAAGNIVIGYTRSGTGAGEFASSYASTGFFDGVSTALAAPLLLQAGSGNYDITFGGTRNRWGDYSQTTVDPNDPLHFWTIQEYASGTNVWSTRITELFIPAGPVTATPEFGSVLSLAGLLAAGVTGIWIQRRRRKS